MRDRFCKLRRSAPVILVLLGGLCCPMPAVAHGVFLFATARGKSIEGEVYFRGGAPARDAKVTVVGPGGEVLGETTTDEAGKFTFAARFRCDHELIADVGQGHRARFTVAADELPGDLPLPEGPRGPSQGQSSEAEPSSPGKHAGTAAAEAAAEELVAAPRLESRPAEIQAIADEIARLRNDLDKYRNELRLRDVLGGLGYILGLMGIVFYFLGVRRKERGPATPDR